MVSSGVRAPRSDRSVWENYHLKMKSWGLLGTCADGVLLNPPIVKLYLWLLYYCREQR